LKLADIKPGDPWLQSAETAALLSWLRDSEETALRSAISVVRKPDGEHPPIEYVGQSDGYRKTINMLTPEANDR
jgi:hypothetical protein